MRATNGRYTQNRLPQEAAHTAAAVGRTVGAAALQAVLVVTAVRVVDAVLQTILEKRQSRRAQVAAKREAVAA